MQRIYTAKPYPEFGPSVNLGFCRDHFDRPKEGGTVRFSWDQTGLYVAAELEDSCLIAQNHEDEQLHYQSGDVFELFLKPRSESYYWEMYAIPIGNKSTLFFPRERGGMKEEDFLRNHDFRALEIAVEKTSRGWNAQMFVPVEQLGAFGAEWGPSDEWTVLCSRYNYNSADLQEPELSMAPPLSAVNFHLTDEYATLRLAGGER